MGGALAGRKIALIGGDERELYLLEDLVKKNLQVNAVGFDKMVQTSNLRLFDDVKEAIKDVGAIILPMTGMNSEGFVKANFSINKIQITEKNLMDIPSHIPIFIGIANEFLKNLAHKYNLKVVETAKIEEIAILNSIPTAEGAIQVAMEESPITIHGSNAVVIGFGNCGKTLARTLDALGAKTTVLARKKRDIARIIEMGYTPAEYDDMNEVIASAEFIFNTIPVFILDKDRLSVVNQDCLIVDIASNPGGTDFKVAEELGIKATLALGLPGKVAPKTAGLILSKVIPKLIQSETSRPEINKVGGINNEAKR
ncbi:dipicolinate synthase subunit A [Desulfonispora thiosulfatigenes DSM 11270]|uniref:Dipicolinate synthase subunit A n=1 Tax=Desulfonispora thiosulfatigenes DSM 11270 TaxID=656914 RepID=A0A1W1VMA2_DESTI|nr:dipicolinate synthase subunit DpsA [Desulfonispora thiosulfatigenes]SMB94515.1 dipicolinate synthase subunit A [Desulfonispora thiosulfatigenes DSM 11270]